MWFDSRRYPNNTYYSTKDNKHDSGGYVSLSLCGDINLTKTEGKISRKQFPILHGGITSRMSGFMLPLTGTELGLRAHEMRRHEKKTFKNISKYFKINKIKDHKIKINRI